jgi:hypothetical protein
MLFYMGLAFRKLGDDRRARECFTTLVDYRTVHRNDEPEVDFFAVSLPDFSIFDEDLGARNRAQCDYLAALGNLGLGDCETAETLLRSTLRTVPDFLRAIVHLRGVHEEL